MSGLPRSWEFGHHTPTAHQGFCTSSPLNGTIQDGGPSPYLWDCISQKVGSPSAPFNMADRMLCTIQHGGQNIFCHDPKINQYGGLNLLRETYIKGLSHSEVHPTKTLSKIWKTIICIVFQNPNCLNIHLNLPYTCVINICL